MNLIGLLVGTLGLERELALAIVAVIMSGGVWAAVAIWPFLAPFVGTINGVIAVFGISAIIGF